jgi:hypothetical protein
MLRKAAVTRRTRWLILLAALIVFAASLAVAAGRLWTSTSPERMRQRIVAVLEERLDGEVELNQISLRLFPTVRVEAEGLVVRHEGRRDVPPLVSVKRIIVDGNLIDLWHRRVRRVSLDSLDITIAPARDARRSVRSQGGEDDRPSRPSKSRPPAEEPVAVKETRNEFAHDIVIDELVADHAQLTILRKEAHKPARVWSMHELHLYSVGAKAKMPFHSVLTNAVPPGEIDTTGSFGPWHRTDPGKTPVEGRFTFNDANLGVFKGISGILSAHGSYGGPLERIEVNGETDTPDFTVSISGHKVPLKTKYHAIVDGTNGNTTLERIDATFFKTSLVARGGVYEVEGVKGRKVVLDVDLGPGRLEDVMRLAVRSSKPPMTGGLRLQTKFELPPGSRDVVEKLRLDGAFVISQGRFTNANVQRKVDELSHRASGKNLAAARTRVASDFAGRFKLRDGTLSLARLTFDVPGAVVELDGIYGLRSGTIDFKGNLYMDAKTSETVSGWKSLVLKVVDPLFRKNGRTVVPITIRGTRENPHFGLDAKRVF